ncbi:synaptic vesicle 2-related protein-like [Mytilus galloprovincialis]|uniref:synaptic vesicle 2-related protein-like n=1 Tax=Mytilus galloprovincialis TaxID=29158 RepID=UPI003F7CA3FC
MDLPESVVENSKQYNKHDQTLTTNGELTQNCDENEKNNEDHTQPSSTNNDIDAVLSNLKFGKFNLKMLAVTGGAYFAICSEMMVIIFLSKPIKDLWKVDHFTYAWLPVATRIGSIIGCFTFGTISDHFGRRIPFIIAIFITAIFGVVSAFATSFIFLVILRAFVSIGTGGIEATNFVLMLEFLPKRNRGAVMVGITFCGALGAILTGGLAWWLLPNYGWQTLLGACAAPSVVVCGIALLFGEESPRYLFISGQKEKGIKLLKKIALQNGTEIENVTITVPPTSDRGRIQDLFKPEHLSSTTFIILIWFLQATGYWGVTVYLPEYITSLGVDGYFNMFMVFIGELPGLCLAMIFVEKHMLGRIKSLRVFSLGTCLSLIVFAVVDLDYLKAAVVIVCYFFMVPIYSLLNTYTPEIYPTKMRGVAMATVNAIIEVPGLITPFVGATLLSHPSKWLYPVVWSVVFFVQFCLMFGLRHETAGDSLRDSDSQRKKDDESQDNSRDESLITAL